MMALADTIASSNATRKEELFSLGYLVVSRWITKGGD
jgi:hypothetical protein